MNFTRSFVGSVSFHDMRTRWAGDRLDVGWAIDVLHPLANS